MAGYAPSVSEPTAPRIQVAPPAPGALRDRLRAALRCPYCRDAVTRRGTVACGRRGCGALYHRDCWDELTQGYGGCAVYGCGERRSREVSAAGWALRLLRLAVAALLLPPRVVRAVVRHRDESFRTIFGHALARAREVGRRWRDSWPLVLVLAAVPVTFTLVPLYPVLFDFRSPRPTNPVLLFVEMAWIGFWILALPMLTPVWVPPLVAFVVALGLQAARGCAAVLRAEVGALMGHDVRGVDTPLARLERGGGAKAKDSAGSG